MITLILTALLPVFLALALGYFAGARKLVDNHNVASLIALLMQFALPITLFVSIARTPQQVILQNARLSLVIALTLLTVYLLQYWLQRRAFRLSTGDAAVQTLVSAFPNYASIGLPLLLPIFGATAAVPVAIAITVGSVTITPVTIALLELHKLQTVHTGTSPSPAAAFAAALSRSVRKPIFIGPILGLLVSLSGLQLPALVPLALAPITACTAGVGLFLTGLMLSAQPIRINLNVVQSVAIKNLGQPLIALALALILALPARTAAEAVLLCTIPAGFFGLVFGASAGVRPAVAGSTLVVSTLCSLVTLATAIAILAPR